MVPVHTPANSVDLLPADCGPALPPQTAAIGNPARPRRCWVSTNRNKMGAASPLTPSVLTCLMLAGSVAVMTTLSADGNPAGSPPSGSSVVSEPSAAALEALVEQLGDSNYAVRERASQRLAAAGAAAADVLLAAAEQSDDLEVALRARWLAESIPFTTGRESPEAIRLLETFAAGDLTARVRIMHRLLRLDDDAGIEPLARIVRLERTAAGSQIAAALLVQDWEPADPYWPKLTPAILAGIGTSSRPAARFLRGLAAHAAANSAAASAHGIEACAAAVEPLTTGKNETLAQEPADQLGEQTGVSRVGSVFRRCLVVLLTQAGRRAEALAQAQLLLDPAAGTVAADRIPFELQWLTARGLPEAVDLVTGQLTDESDPFLAYAAASAWLKRDGEEAESKAASLAAAASRRLGEKGVEDRLTAAGILARWGEIEWATREYQTILDAPESRPAERALAAIYFAELLHDQERNAEAAAVLRRMVEAGEKDGEDLEQGLMQLGREPRESRSRMLFFAACAEADGPTRRRLIDESLTAFPDDVDSLITAYQLTADEPDRRAEIVRRIAAAAATIDQEIRNLPADSTSRNEYAWLIANTEGDLAKATRYSRQSLEDSFDSASYLDTLAHCHAAAGNLERAIRTQWIAVKKEPHSLLIRRNFARFQSRAGVRP
jgi:hypothetical protein